MHHAPAVSFPVGASRLAAVLHLAVAGIGLLAALGWCARFAAFDAATLAVALTAVAGLVLAWRAGCAAPRGTLLWDGAQWTMTDSRGRVQQAECTLNVFLDLGTLMLARCVSVDGHTTWPWLDRAADPLRWRALRRAAFDGARAASRRVHGAVA